MSGRETHATRIPFHPELVSLRVLLQSTSARHNVRYSPFRVGKLLEPRTQLQSFVLGLYYLTRKDDGHVREARQVMANSAEAGSAAQPFLCSSALRNYAFVSLPRHVYSDSPNYRVP
jgi:hypothetical protein